MRGLGQCSGLDRWTLHLPKEESSIGNPWFTRNKPGRIAECGPGLQEGSEFAHTSSRAGHTRLPNAWWTTAGGT